MKELSIEETKEIWKQIEEEDFNSYSVSNLGRIKNRKGKILKPQLICGYLYCILRRKNGKNTSRRINRLVALAFCDGYKDGYVANHIDHDRLNNRADNLEWCTQKENTNTELFKKHLSEALLSSNKVRRKRVKQLSKDGKLIRVYPSLAKAAEDHKVKQPSLSACCLGKTKTCNGYKWEYENEND